MPSDNLPPLPAHLDPRGKRGARKAARAAARATAQTGEAGGRTRSSRHHGRGRSGHVLLKQVSLYSTAAIATLLSIALLVGTGIYWWQYRQFNGSISRIDISTAQKNGPSKHGIGGQDMNILIVGNDDRNTASAAELAQLGTTRDGGSLNTDTMMIIHVPANGEKATLISLPRDSYVSIPGNGMAKLNSAYADAYNATTGSFDQKRAAGANLLIETVQNLTGLAIDHYVQVDLLGFYRISNAVGGVPVNMCAAVKEPNSGINLPKGISLIKGTQALAFVRQRYGFPDGLGDLDRVKRQQYFLTSAFRKIASAGVLLKLQSLLNAIKSSIHVDSGLNLLDLGQQLENLTANNIVGKTIPTGGFNDNSPVGSVLVVRPAEVQAFMQQLIGNTDSKLAGAPLVAPSTVPVTVYNAGTGENGVATTAGNELKSIGFQVGTVADSGTPVTATTIEYADGMQGQAKTLAKYVPGALLVKTAVPTLTLLLGPDGVRVKVPTSPAASATSTSTSAPPTSAAKPTAPKPSSSTTAAKAIDSTCIY